MPTEKMTNNLKNCPRFPTCSINKCPLDHKVELRTELPEEERCPFMTRKRKKGQKGIKLLAPDSILKVIPESNVKLLNKRNQKRWHDLYKKI
jgi:hypothetical protein